MEKSRDIKNYIDTVKNNSDFFKQYYYHSIIDSNLTKLDQILKRGLLCKSLIERYNLISLYTHQSDDFDSKNGKRYISLTEYTDKCEFITMFEAFPFHTLTSVSVLVNKDIPIEKQGERETYFDDEVFSPVSIPTSKLEGIILPEHLSNLQIKELCCLPTDLSCYTKRYINHWIESMEQYFQRRIKTDEIKKSLDELWDIFDGYESPEKWVNSAIATQRKRYGKDIRDVLAEILQELWMQKMIKSNPTCLDVIKYINKDELPIYEIQGTCLKKKL